MSARQITDSGRPKAGSRFGTSDSDQSLPLGYIQTPQRIRVLDQASAERVMTDGLHTATSLRLHSRVWANSFRWWSRPESPIRDRVLAGRFARKSKAMVVVANNRPNRSHVEIPEARLRKLVAKRYSIQAIADDTGTTYFIVLENLERYGIRRRAPLKPSIRKFIRESVPYLEPYAPGLTEAAKKYPDNSEQFFALCYAAHLRVQQVSWSIKKVASANWHHRNNGQRGNPVKTEICWNRHVGEVTLAIALREAGIRHYRQWGHRTLRRRTFDFCLPDYRVLVEVDGAYHELPQQKKVDRIKAAWAEKRGYTLLRIDEALARTRPDKAMDLIRRTISSVSNLSDAA